MISSCDISHFVRPVYTAGKEGCNIRRLHPGTCAQSLCRSRGAGTPLSSNPKKKTNPELQQQRCIWWKNCANTSNSTTRLCRNTTNRLLLTGIFDLRGQWFSTMKVGHFSKSMRCNLNYSLKQQWWVYHNKNCPNNFPGELFVRGHLGLLMS